MGSYHGEWCWLGCESRWHRCGHGIGVDIGRGVDMGVSIDGDYTVEENRGRWLGTIIFNFRRLASSLEIIEASITAKQT